jgi:hypothetical protein
MATNLYAFWKLSGNPPSPWSKVATYDGKYVRSTSNVANALTTGGALTHNHSLGTGHTISTTNDRTDIYSTVGTVIAMSYSAGHNHAIGTVAPSLANNAPAYYDFSLISIGLAEFMTSQKKLPKGAVVASNAAISTTGYSRVTATDGKLIRLGPTPGVNSSTTTHTHGFAGALSDYTSSSNQTRSGALACSVKSADYKHSHGVSALSTSSATLMPARIQTRLYEVTSDPYNLEVPVDSVLFVDGALTGYTDTFETLADWNNRFIESANSIPTQTGSDVHNHGSSVSGTSDDSGLALYNADYSFSGIKAINKPHTHSLSLVLDATDVDHKPSYVYLAAVRVKAAIRALQTFTKTYGMDLLVKQVHTKTYGMDLILFKAGNKYYNMDILLQKKGLTKSVSMDIQLMTRGTKSYTADLLIKRMGMSISYQMGMAPLFARRRTYEMGIRIVNPGAIPRYAVIDVLQDSWIAQYNKFMQTVEASRVSLKIETASGYDLERRWGRAFNLPRDPDETDTHYRARLMSYMASVTGCGTKPAIETALNIATGGQAARVDVYPGLIRVNFDSDYQRRAATERRVAIEKILNLSVAAGIQWILYSPYKDYEMGISIRKERLTKDYNLDILLQKRAIGITYAMDIVLCNVRTKTYTVDVMLKKACLKTYRMFMRLKKIGLAPYVMDMRLTKKSIPITYTMDVMLKKHCSKSYFSKIILQKFGITKSYAMDLRLTKTDYRAYQMGVILKAKFAKAYTMDILLALHRGKTYTMDILLANEIHKSYSVDLLIKKYDVDKNYTMDILLANERTATIDVDIVLKKTVAKSYSVDILLKKTFLIDYSMDIRLKTVRAKSYVMDLYLMKKAKTRTYTMDMMLKRANPKTYSMDVLMIRRRVKALLMDILVKKERLLKSYAMDILVKSKLTKVYSMGILLQRQGTNHRETVAARILNGIPQSSLDIAVGGKIYAIPQENIILPELVYGSYKDINGLNQYFSVDIPANTLAYSTIKANLCNYISVGTLPLVVYQGEIEGKTLATEVTDVDYTGLNGLTNYSILIISIPQTSKTYIMDLMLRKGHTKSFLMDIILVKRMGKSYMVDIRLMKKAQTKTYALDLMLKKKHLKTYTMDIQLRKAILKTYQADILLKGRNTKPLFMDIVLAKRMSKSYVMDIYLMQKARTRTYAMDVMLKKVISKTYTADILIHKKGVLKTYSMSLRIATLWKRLNYRMDILLRKTLVKSYVMDIYLMKKAQTRTYAMDIMLKRKHTKGFSMDVRLATRHTKTLAIDTLLAGRRMAPYGMGIKISEAV